MMLIWLVRWLLLPTEEEEVEGGILMALGDLLSFYNQRRWGTCSNNVYKTVYSFGPPYLPSALLVPSVQTKTSYMSGPLWRA